MGCVQSSDTRAIRVEQKVLGSPPKPRLQNNWTANPTVNKYGQCGLVPSAAAGLRWQVDEAAQSSLVVVQSPPASAAAAAAAAATDAAADPAGAAPDTRAPPTTAAAAESPASTKGEGKGKGKGKGKGAPPPPSGGPKPARRGKAPALLTGRAGSVFEATRELLLRCEGAVVMHHPALFCGGNRCE